MVLTGELRTCLCRYDHTSMHLIGWQKTWEQAPGVPPPLPRSDGGGQPWPCTCIHGPKKSTRQRACHQPVQETMPTAELPQFLHCLDQPRHLSLHNDRHVNDSVQHRSSNCGISTISSQTAPRNLPDLHNQHQHPCQCTATRDLNGSLNSETMGSCLCAPTGMLTTLERNCNCGTSTVMRLWIRAFAAHTTGMTTLSKSCTCGMAS